ncbi:ATP synthase F1 subunit delta [Draconibacterium halophilum]|uniref:ATP synthase subunit delta n=1 Tax=Draconibacterium halophilum TaxID=2706887 RepID=A0A6C0R8E2_9BACT|nr:ATP synthase F1 subunit delta [Draconibacterium halophilum]QIA06688.1 ATP synthase F1 subunit delta [Draconibacterium halophilum]
MDQSTINVRYAKAFFLTAKEKKLLDKLKADIQLVLNVSKASEDFILLLESPIVKSSKKAALIKSIFESKIEEISLNFLLLIIQNKREEHIPGICRNFLDLSRKDLNIKSAMLTTASEVDSSTLKKIQELLEKELKATVELTAQINTKIIGGLVLRLDDKQYDASVATQLRKVKQTLLETEL